MRRKNWYLLFSLLLVMGMILVACGGGTAEEPAAEEPAAEEPMAEEEPAEEEPMAEEEPAAEEAPTEEPMEEEMAEFEPMSVAAENCDYGGKIESIEATGEYEVVFNLCKPDPAFLAKVAFLCNSLSLNLEE